ncbi:MAG: DUF3667 domain-containing protein [Pseudomarimonas sp.]
MNQAEPDASTTSRVCGNCGVPMLGDHCYHCGQPVKGLVRHFGSIVGDFMDSVFDFDSRTVRTLGPLFYRPGYLSNEYVAGRRVRYVSPVRLFVFLCIVSFFVLTVWVGPDLDDAMQFDDGGFAQLASVAEVEKQRDRVLAEMQRQHDQLADSPGQAGVSIGMEAVRDSAKQRIDELTLPAGASPAAPAKRRSALTFGEQPWHAEDNPVRIERLSAGANEWLNRMIGRADANMEKVQGEPRLLLETVLQTLPQTFFVLLPIFALMLKSAYLFKRRLYMEHLILALHSHAFLCLSLLLYVGIDALRGLLDAGLLHDILTGAERVLLVWLPLYLLLGLKRFYRQGWIMTTIKFFLISVAYLLLVSVAAVFNLAFNLVLM